MSENENAPRKGRATKERIFNNSMYSGMGNLPPQDQDAERAVIGAVLLVARNVPKATWGLIRPEIFYNEGHSIICQAIMEMYADGKPIDLITVASHLRTQGKLEHIGGAYALTEITQRVSQSHNIDEHLNIITYKFMQRELIRVSTESISEAYDDTDNPYQIMTKMVTQINDLKKGVFKRTEKRMDELLFLARTEMERPKVGGLLGSSTGKKGLDHILQGHQPNQLGIKAARPAMGKTADMCSEILHKGFVLKEPVACFSLEMSSVQLVFRLWANASNVATSNIKHASFTRAEEIQLEKFEELLADTDIFIDDTGGLTIDEFETKAALLVGLYGVKSIYIDYLQLMQGSPYKRYGNREGEVSDISRRLKGVAKELNITIIALCQLSREVEKRALCKPVLSDLRESGSIEQDADWVEFLWRPEYYPHVMAELAKDGAFIDIELFDFRIYDDFKGLVVCIVAKCREEATGNVPLRFDGKIMRISDHPQVVQVLESKNDLFQQQQMQAPAPFKKGVSLDDDIDDAPPF